MKIRSNMPGILSAVRGFSMIELLLVITIMALLVAVTVPAVQGLMNGRNLGDAGGVITSQLELARQTAIARNAAVQWQIVKVPDLRTGDPVAFRLIRSLILEPGSREWRPIGRSEWLPKSTWVDEDAARSPMLVMQTNTSDLPSSIAASNSIASFVIFDGAGRVGVDTTNNWLTVVGRGNTNNFITVQIEPVSGRVRTYRPGP